MKLHLQSVTFGLWLFAAAGCSFMAPQPDRTQYFILSPAESGSTAVLPIVQTSTARLSIGVGPIKFPDYLKRPWVVTRAASNRLMISDEKRWGEPLDRNFETILCQNLSVMLGTQKIVAYPWYADNHVDYQVQVWVSRFEASENGASQLSAVWAVYHGSNGSELASGQTSASVAVQPGDDGPSAALSRDLAEMSRQIAERIAQVNSIQKPGAAQLNSRGRLGPG